MQPFKDMSKNKFRAKNNADRRSDTRINRFTLKQYYEAVRQYKTSALIVLIGFSIATICFGALLPYSLASAIDLVGQRQSLALGSELTNTLLLAAGIAVVGTIANGIGLRGLAWLDSRAQNYIRAKVFNRLVHESATYYANTMTGSLTSNVIAYTNGYMIVQEVIFQRGLNLVLPLVVGICLVATQSLLLAGLFLLIAVGIGIKTLSDSRVRTPYRRQRKETMSRLNGFLGDVISNSATVRIFAGEAHEKRGLREKQTIWGTAAAANFRKFAEHYTVLVGSMNIMQVAGITLAAYLATTGQIGLGLAVFAISYLQRLSNGLLDLGSIVQSYQGALMDAAPISELLMSSRVVTDLPGAKDLKVTQGEIDIRNIRYKYEKNGLRVFDGLSLHIPAGQSVGLIGRSGGGKTTLTHLLLRSADIESGTITLDSQDISSVTQHSLRSAVSYVPQDSQLFHRSIRDNIAYGKPDARDKEIIAAAKKAHIWEVIENLPNGLDTKVGERGVKLSGGQKQRVAIARAILKNAPILIFDEATSALDSESEKHIQASLDELVKGRTAIVIAHRLSTIQKMDRIIVLDKGQIVEDGTHAQLVKKKGLYASLWSHQSGGFISE